MKSLHTRKGGFTLIELMIVVAIIGILAAIAIPNFLRFQLRARSSEGKTNLAAIRTAEEGYNAEFGTYLDAAREPGARVPGSAKVVVERRGRDAGRRLRLARLVARGRGVLPVRGRWHGAGAGRADGGVPRGRARGPRQQRRRPRTGAT